MKRTNNFRLTPDKPQERNLLVLCHLSTVLWNKITYKRRQSFFKGGIDWDTTREYHAFSSKLGSATTQQLIRKNNESWRSFFVLLKKKKQGKLPPHIKRICPPGYWKDRKTGRRILKTVIRSDCYRFEGRQLLLPKKLSIRYNGKSKWVGKQGRLEIHYDYLSGRWYANQPVECQSLHQPIGNKKAYIDLGVLNLLTTYTEGDDNAVIYSSRSMLSDWWWWNKQIADHQRILKNNNKYFSNTIRRGYRKRTRRFRQAVNTLIYRFITSCYKKGVSEVIVGDLRHIRTNISNKGKKANAMINNFWSFRYVIERLKLTSENFGINVKEIDESWTSQTCCLCGKRHRNGRRHRGLYVCKTYDKAFNADVNSVANIANPIFPSPLKWDRDNWVMAHPLTVSIGDS